MSTLSTIIKEHAALKAKISELGQESLKPLFEAIFKEFPDATALRWTQWTPAFNDGDPCVFMRTDVNMSFPSLDEDAGDQEDGFVCPDGYGELVFGETKYEEARETFAEINKRWSATVGILESVPDEIMEGIFGDQVEITVTPEGIVVVEDSEYGY